MSATKEYLEQLERIKAGELPSDLSAEDLENRLEELRKQNTSVESKPKENPAYEAQETLVFRGRMAPAGSVFLVVKHKANRKIYSNVACIGKGFSKEQKEQICFRLWERLKSEYKL